MRLGRIVTGDFSASKISPGVRVMANSRAPNRAKPTVKAMGRNSLPSAFWNAISGA